MINLLLVVIAKILFLIISPLNFIYTNFIKRKFNWKRLNKYLLDEATSIDRYGNFNFRSLLNKILVEENGYKHGNFEETISSVLGKNQRDGTQTRFGVIVSNILDYIDEDHCKNSINNNI